MFGYVRPLKGELKVAEYERFRAEYCGLCHALKKRYGLPARFMLSYDLTFFSTVLSALEGNLRFEHKRCIASPFAKKCITCSGEGSFLAADITVILFYWKLEDGIRDAKGLKKLGTRLLRVFVSPMYRKSIKFRPEFAKKVEHWLGVLAGLEESRSDSIDACADSFAQILLAAVHETQCSTNERRALEYMFYNIGRWIYIIDACDDYGDDISDGSYNPLIYRYGLTESSLPENIKEEIKLTLSHSMAAAASAFELIDFGPMEGLIANIIYLGLNGVTGEVLSGEWRQRRRINERPV